MKFSEYKYVRPEVEVFKPKFEELLVRFNRASSFEEQGKIMDEIIVINNDYDTMATLTSIRNSIDTTDEFYDKENDYFDTYGPVFQGFSVDFYKALISSKFRTQLEEKYGAHLFTLAEMQIKTFSDEVLEDLQEENKLVSQYNKLVASAKIEFKGEIRNLSQMAPFKQDKDRNIRKEANEKSNAFFEEHEKDFDEIYDKLVKVRTKIAQKLGFKNFVELAYTRMRRSEYGAKEVAWYREQVYKHIVPVAVDLRKRQAKRLGIEDFKYYDTPLSFNSGNAVPKGNKDWMVDKARTMYKELSPETDEFFSFMADKELLDLDSKKGKQSGGYCTYIANYRSPFIFANFNGTSGDVDVLTHEAGHAFQVFQSRDLNVPEYGFPTYEACEIHSMSMEFITWPWMKLFFEELELKYKFSHLAGGLLFIPYGVSVDEFQHFVYENPNATPDERKTKWREIEKKYLPTIDYDGNDFMERGGFWFRQGHIFASPFYYIDYTLAQVCAYQYWVKFNENRKTAWEDYLRLCRAGGSKPFLELVKIGNIKNPFEPGIMESIIPPIKEWLNGVDDTKL